jgi:hypothetical protein
VHSTFAVPEGVTGDAENAGYAAVKFKSVLVVKRQTLVSVASTTTFLDADWANTGAASTRRAVAATRDLRDFTSRLL